MGMMCDAQCQKCGKRFGWAGHAIDRPPCPRCGHQIDVATRAHDARLIEEGREMMSARSPETKSGRTERVWVEDWHPKAYVYVGRAKPQYPSMAEGKFGNPFSAVGKGLVQVASRELAFESYRRWLIGDPFVAEALPLEEEERRLAILAALPSLRGKRLACWRHGDSPCHASILCDLADNGLQATKGG